MTTDINILATKINLKNQLLFIYSKYFIIYFIYSKQFLFYKILISKLNLLLKKLDINKLSTTLIQLFKKETQH